MQGKAHVSPPSCASDIHALLSVLWINPTKIGCRGDVVCGIEKLKRVAAEQVLNSTAETDKQTARPRYNAL